MKRAAWIQIGSKFLFVLGLAIPLIGTWRAYDRGGLDFLVFYEAGRLMLSGWGEQIYKISPDRFLYAPGFAVLFTPLSALSFEVGLAVWSALKFLALLSVVLALRGLVSKKTDQNALLGVALLFCARPIWIDFQYGQINTLLLCVAFWALWWLEWPAQKDRENLRGGQFQMRESLLIAACWGALALFAFSKVILAPLLVLPWIPSVNRASGKIAAARIGSALGLSLVISAPFLAVGWDAGSILYQDWWSAILAKGIPNHSHNQSVAALLLHWFSGDSTHVQFLGAPQSVGAALLSSKQVWILSTAWSLFSLGILLSLLLSWKATRGLRSLCLSLGWTFLPSHLIWKPYFVFSLPLVWFWLRTPFQSPRVRLIQVLALFALMNLTGFDFVGKTMGVWFETAGVFLFVHLAVLVLVWWDQRALEGTR